MVDKVSEMRALAEHVGAWTADGYGKSAIPCSCLDVVDVKLSERNTRIMRPLILRAEGEESPPTRAMIVTEQVETGRGKKKACGMFATYCPFCGRPYEPKRERS